MRVGKHNAIVKAGYLIMLVTRLFAEMLFLYLERELGQHQSQNGQVKEILDLKEKWYCFSNTHYVPTNNDITNTFMPEQNRSIFWTEDFNLACGTQPMAFTCWIPYAKMKSYGLKFMYGILVVNFLLTSLELIVALIASCRNKKP